jgi:hypothetical protein
MANIDNRRWTTCPAESEKKFPEMQKGDIPLGQTIDER